MLKELEICGNVEIDKLAAYLLESNVPYYGEQLRLGQVVLKKGVVDSLATLGNIKTYTGVIPESAVTGPNIPTAPLHKFNGVRKYLVKEQIPFMGTANIEDNGHIQTIRKYIKQIKMGGQLDMIITVLKKLDDYLLLDGNKRTVAFYEYALKKKVKNIEYPIFIIEH